MGQGVDISLTFKCAGLSVTDLVLSGMAGMLNDPDIAAKLVAGNPDIATAIVAGMVKNPAKLVAGNPDTAVAMVAGRAKDPAKLVAENPDIAAAMVAGMVKDPAKFVAENRDLAAKLVSAEARNWVAKLAAKHPEFEDFAAMSVVGVVVRSVMSLGMVMMLLKDPDCAARFDLVAKVCTSVCTKAQTDPEFAAKVLGVWLVYSVVGEVVVAVVVAVVGWCVWVVRRLAPPLWRPPFWRRGTLIGPVRSLTLVP